MNGVRTRFALLRTRSLWFAFSAGLVVLAVGSIAAAVESDDFSANNLNTGFWQFVNPFGVGSVRITGVGTADAHLELSVPVGPSHDPYGTNRAVRIMQPQADVDFGMASHFLSEPSLRYQLQGFIIEQDDDNWIRFDIFHDGTNLRFFAATTTNGSSSSKVNDIIPSASAAHLRVQRTGDLWTFERSSDGTNWTTGTMFSHALTVNAVGVFCANHASSGDSPAFTTEIDYVFAVGAPISPEDGFVAPDSLPPLIHGIDEVALQANAAQIAWFTDEPALGTVEYGPTAAYESGAISDSGGTYAHGVTLPGLVPGNTYHFRLRSEDDAPQESVTGDMQFVFDPSGPVLDIWYGASQSFGHFGDPQPWANILGHVSDSDGVSSLSYTLNGGVPVSLSIGPDGRRLVSPGDFNVDLATSDLLDGTNTVIITATDAVANVTADTVLVPWQSGTDWQVPYAVDWSTLTSDDEIQDVAQVVDGKWTVTAAAVRTVEPGYDRLVAMGDSVWTDYEVLVPITLHTAPGGCGVGVLFRWNGHTDTPVVCGQPKCGYLPLGGILWYRPGRLEVYGNGGTILDSSSRTLVVGTTYWFRGRVETTPIGAVYRLRVWEDGQLEPSGWDITGQAGPGDPAQGSTMLISHQADASFGNVSITELTPPPNLPPVANNDIAFVAPGDSVVIDVVANDTDIDGTVDPTTVMIQAVPLHGNASVNPLTGVITYLHDGSLTTNDSITYTVRDDDGDPSNTAVVSLTITPEGATQIASEDFNRCEFDTQRWTFENPSGFGSMAQVGFGTGDAWLELSLPAGTAHDAWGAGGANEAVRVMQNAANTDFTIEVHWKAEPTAGYNDQGILVEQDDVNWLRFDVYHSNTTLKAFMGRTVNGNNTTLLNANISVGTASFMRVERSGNTWTLSLSGDGDSWSQAGQFTQAMNVTQVGVYAANPVEGLDWTSQVDWFFDATDPIVPEDQGDLGIIATTVGAGTVVVIPDLLEYDCGQVVTIAAVADSGWGFDGWSGDVTNPNNPVALRLIGAMRVTAHFAPDQSVDVLDDIPGPFVFRGAWPNPFVTSTQIAFDLPTAAMVEVTILDVAGRLVRRLVNGERFSRGARRVHWDGRSTSGQPVARGIYFCRVEAAGVSQTRRLLRLR